MLNLFGEQSFEPDYRPPVNIEPPRENEITRWEASFYDYAVDFLKAYYPEDSSKINRKTLLDIHDVPRLFSLLVQREFVTCPKMDVYASWLSSYLRELFPGFDVAVVSLGAAVNGGIRVRRVFSPEDITKIEDFDWGLIFRGGTLNSRNLKSMPMLANNFFNQNFDGSLESCSCVNPKNLNHEHINSVEDAISVLVKWYGSPRESWRESDLLFLFFAPSYPTRYNEENRKHIRHALELISVDDFSFWKKLVKEILTSWHQIHRIKAKHLESDIAQNIGGFSLETRALKIASDSARMMSMSMFDWLNSTNRNEHWKNVKWWSN